MQEFIKDLKDSFDSRIRQASDSGFLLVALKLWAESEFQSGNSRCKNIFQRRDG